MRRSQCRLGLEEVGWGRLCKSKVCRVGTLKQAERLPLVRALFVSEDLLRLVCVCRVFSQCVRGSLCLNHPALVPTYPTHLASSVLVRLV